MSEPTTQCSACGAPIPQCTANEHDGLCARCHRRAAPVCPHDCEIPRDLVERMLSMNEDPVDYRETVRRNGAAFVHSLLDSIPQCDDLYLKWSPKVREFAKKCRAAHPWPGERSLCLRDRAKLAIYESKIRDAERLPRRERKVVFCCLPLTAMHTAQRLWPGDDDRCVFLTPDEKALWNQVYSHPTGSFWWFIHYWWNVEDALSTQDHELTAPDNSDRWLVVSGLQWGPFAGSQEEELWSWNGREAKLINQLGRTYS